MMSLCPRMRALTLRLKVPELDLQNLSAEWEPRFSPTLAAAHIPPFVPVAILEVQLARAMLQDYGKDGDCMFVS